MIIKVLILLGVAFCSYSIGFLRGAYKTGDKYMKSYITFRKNMGVDIETISKETMEIIQITKKNESKN